MTGGSGVRSLLRAVDELAPRLNDRALAAERAGTMDPDLVADAKTAGLFRLGLPASLGGWELDPAAIFSVIERLSRADGSAGWTVAAGNGSTLLAWLEPDAARKMLAGKPDVAVSGVTAPLGRADALDDGTFSVHGRWPLSSGCRHSEWIVAGVHVMDGGRRRQARPGQADSRIAWLPRGEVEIVDTWEASGLRGTGSDDVVAHGILVPQEHLCSPLFEPARHQGPLYRLSLYNLIAVFLIGVPSGIARRALDEFIALAGTKVRTGARRALANDESVQVALAIAEGDMRAGRSLVLEAVADIWATVVAGEETTLQQRVAVLLAANTLVRLGVRAVDTVFSLAGASALYCTSPLQRCFRDIHAVSQHVLFGPETLKKISRVSLGNQLPTMDI